jgi:hypothetical protein
MALHNSGELGCAEQAFARGHAPPLHRRDSVGPVEGLGYLHRGEVLDVLVSLPAVGVPSRNTVPSQLA